MANNDDGIEFHLPTSEADLKTAWVPVYDPGTKQVSNVTPVQAQNLKANGHFIGPEAMQAAQLDNWGGIKAFTDGLASGGTLGGSDLLKSPDAYKAAEMLKKLHPYASMAGQAAGMVGYDTLTGGMGVIPQLATRVLANGVRGATEEVARAQANSEPIQAERMLHAGGLGALFGAFAEAPGALAKAVPGILKGVVNKADKLYRAEPRAWEFSTGELTPKYRRALAEDWSIKDLGIFGTLAHQVPGVGHALSAGTAILAADKAVTKILNNKDAVNSAIEKFGQPAAKALGNTLNVLTKPALAASLPFYMKDPDKHYEKAADGVVAVVNNPEGFADSFQGGMKSAFRNHPGLQFGMTMKALQAAQALHARLPQNPNDPSFIGEYKPTREQKLKFLEAYHTLTDFPEAMQTPTPTKVAIAKEAMPEHLQQLQNLLQGHLLINGDKGLSRAQKRAISLILGGAATPDMQSRYLQGLQVSAPPPPVKPMGQGAGLGVHGAQAVTLRDAPDSMKQQLGASF